MDDFEAACKAAARQLRRMPAELRRDAGKEVQQLVAQPLADDIAAAARGATPWGVKIAPVVKARIQTDPTIAVGAAKRVFSGGASVNQVLYGAEFGGGRTRRVSATSRSGKTFRRRGTVQFIRKSNSYIYATLERTKAKYLEQWAKVLDPVLDRWENGS